MSEPCMHVSTHGLDRFASEKKYMDWTGGRIPGHCFLILSRFSDHSRWKTLLGCWAVQWYKMIESDRHVYASWLATPSKWENNATVASL